MSAEPIPIEVIFTKANGNPQTRCVCGCSHAAAIMRTLVGLGSGENGITKGTEVIPISPGQASAPRAQAVDLAVGAPLEAPNPKTARPCPSPTCCGQLLPTMLCCGRWRKWHHQGQPATPHSAHMTWLPRHRSSRSLWRSEKVPGQRVPPIPFAVRGSPPAYYADAVLWAVKEAHHQGNHSTTIQPQCGFCTRAQSRDLPLGAARSDRLNIRLNIKAAGHDPISEHRTAQRDGHLAPTAALFSFRDSRQNALPAPLPPQPSATPERTKLFPRWTGRQSWLEAQSDRIPTRPRR